MGGVSTLLHRLFEILKRALFGRQEQSEAWRPVPTEVSPDRKNIEKFKKSFLIDGSNFIYDNAGGRRRITEQRLHQLLRAVREDGRCDTLYFDVSAGNALYGDAPSPRDRPHAKGKWTSRDNQAWFSHRVAHDFDILPSKVIMVTGYKADKSILVHAKNHKLPVISNDRYQDEDSVGVSLHRVVFDKGRALIQPPVQGTPATPKHKRHHAMD